MTAAASRELRNNNTRALLDRVDAGEVITITVNGREVAELRPGPETPPMDGRCAVRGADRSSPR